MKWIILFVLCLGFAHLQAEKVCEPGTTSKQDCNTCKCSVDGTRLACTRRFCLPHEVTRKVKREGQEDEEQTVPTGNQVCVPDEIKMEDCNRCRCANNGIGFFCTKRVCPPKETQEVKQTEETRETRVTRQAPKPKLGDKDFSCTPGEQFMNKCNTCTCSSDGKNAACTLQHCISWYEDGKLVTEDTIQTPVARVTRQTKPKPGDKDFRCTPGEKFLNKCNTCTCNADGTNAACTLQHCISWYEDGKLVTEDTVSHRRRRDTTPAFLQAGFTCTPGEQFPYECNTCLCAKDGKNVSCTRKFCTPSRRRRDLPAFFQPGFTCTPGDQFPYECNTCTCAKDGKNVSCTRKFCNRKRRDVTTPAVNTPGFTCTPRSVFKNDCNTCHCNDDGVSAACTFMLCPGESTPAVVSPPALACSPGETYLDHEKTCVCNADGASGTCAGDAQPYKREAEFSCEPGTSFQRDCNTCICSKDGKSAACTLRFCLPQSSRKRRDLPAFLQPGFTCTPGDQFPYECNTCTCAKDGKNVACTRQFCVPSTRKRRDLPAFLQEGFTCTPGEQFPYDCNTCTCAKNGKNVSCTRKFCSRKRRDVTTPAVNTPGFTCTPRTTFKNDCNTCHCSDDGVSAACTFMLCPGEATAAVVSPPALACSPGETFLDYEKTCVCNADGASAACVGDAQPYKRAAEFSCTPGASFKRDCNTCSCSADGKFETCTDMECEDTTDNVKQDCVPGTRFLADDGCNSCFCTPTGVKACTFMLCPEKSTPRIRRQSPNRGCTPGTSYTASDGCNTCFCSGTGHDACTAKFCLSNTKSGGAVLAKRDTKAASCTPGTSYPAADGCNTCICSGTGHDVCTLKFCLSSVNSEGATLAKRDTSAAAGCTPGTSYKAADGCNTCICSGTGHDVCTLKFCLSSANSEGATLAKRDTAAAAGCTPGTSYKAADGCNTCICSGTGHDVCTLKFCLSSANSEEATLAKRDTAAVAGSSPAASCTPGTSYKAADGCNTCICSGTGHDVCTLKFCLNNSQGATLAKRDTTAAQTQKCVPGTRFMAEDGCNSCFCTPNGEQACTEMLCE